MRSAIAGSAFVLTAGAVGPVAGGAYLGMLAFLARRPERDTSRPANAEPNAAMPPYTVVVVPAHNEAFGIGATVTSLLSSDYPVERREVLVVADNCSDGTAAIAREAGATVIERVEPNRRGKGFALALAFETLMSRVDTPVEVVVVVDADSVVSPNLLGAVASAVHGGADAVQARYGVRNADESWRTRLMTIGFTCFHDVRSLGRERLSVSCGLRGNGMGFSRRALSVVPHSSTSIVEDLEHGIQLGLAGIRVRYLHHASVLADMPATGEASRSQRDRWERGRSQVRTKWSGPLVRRAWQDRNAMCADLAMDVLVPPLGQLAAVLLTGTALSALALTLGGSGMPLAAWSVGLAGLVVHVARGWQLSDTGVRGLADLARAPGYVAWKFAAKATRSFGGGSGASPDPQAWVRTVRAAETVTHASPVRLDATELNARGAVTT